MDLRRLIVAVGVGTLGLTTAVVALPSSALAAPAAPKSLAVSRAADDVYKVKVTWKSVPAIDHYAIDIIAGDVQTVLDLPATATEYTIDAPNPCTAYKIRVGAVDASGETTNTGYWSLRALTPSAVMGMAPTRTDDGTTATASWRVPAWTGYTPLTGYRSVFTRLSDGVVLADQTSMDMSFRYAGIDADRAYTLAVTTVNEYGACVTAKSLIDRYRPADPTNLVVERRSDAPGTVDLVWKAPTTGPAPTYYQIGYGTEKVTKLVKVDASARTTSLSLAADKSWVVELKAYNENGGSSAVTGTVPVWDPNAEPPAQETDTTIVPSGPDRVPPTITTSLSQKPVNGWFRTPVTISFTCADDGGIASCPAPVLAGTDGLARRFSGTAKDSAGNTTTTTLTLKIDQTAPQISAEVIGTKNANGWYTTTPRIHYTCTDATSTISSCPADTTVADGLAQKITGIALDKAGNTATTTVALDVDVTAPAVTTTVDQTANSAGWYRTAPTVHFNCTDGASGLASCPADNTVTADGAGQVVSGTAVDKAGNTANTSVTLNVDRTAPAITAALVETANEAGWLRTAPTIRFTCTDAGSGIATCPADTTVDTDGAAQVVSGTAVDKAGNTTSTSVTVNVDRTVPAISATTDVSPNSAGWYRTAPTVHFTCTDATSGLVSCPDDTTVTADGAAQVVNGTTTDKAGNTAATSVTVSVDRTAPAIIAALTGPANGAGWHRAAPTVTFTCTDTGSGIADCPADVKVDADGAGQVVTGTAVDKAGNTTTTSVTVNVDKTAPSITAGIDATPNSAGWYRTAPTVTFACTDATSGLVSCPEARTVTADGVDQVVTGSTTDKAGNTATTSVTVNVDKTAPKITAALVGTPNSAGWHRTPPTVKFTCTDTGSGIADCPADATVDADGAAQVVTGTATDKAGNISTVSVTVNVDKTVPVITTTVDGSANDAGWYRTAPTVKFTCTDAGSGIGTCPAGKTLTADGAGQVVTGTATDKAGNSAGATVTLNVDKTAPKITSAVTGTANAAGWYRTSPTVKFTCTDVLSGIAACPAETTVATDGATQVVTGVTSDKAGNTATATATVKVDRTAPVVTVAGVTDGAVLGPDANPVVTCATTDPVSGVATAATISSVVSNGLHTVKCSGAVDKAGNAAATVQVSYSVKLTVPWLVELTRQYAGGASAVTLQQLEADLVNGRITAYIAKVTAMTNGNKPTLTPIQAATLSYWALMLVFTY
ncbi:Neogenin [Actinoplanes subglobosus]|uniref:Neogenin n=1 Tax=Actinoplanes subglobosus TaxID=1547892 RepID=A0ABV8IQP9_9ACTN